MSPEKAEALATIISYILMAWFSLQWLNRFPTVEIYGRRHGVYHTKVRQRSGHSVHSGAGRKATHKGAKDNLSGVRK